MNQKFGRGSGGWLGHTLRRPPGDIAKAALEWNPPWGPDPRTTWRRTILEEIRHQDKTREVVKVLARNRVRWRNFARALCCLQGLRETIYKRTIESNVSGPVDGCTDRHIKRLGERIHKHTNEQHVVTKRCRKTAAILTQRTVRRNHETSHTAVSRSLPPYAPNDSPPSARI